MEQFAVNQRVQVVNTARLTRTSGQPASEWLLRRVGAVRAPALGTPGAWIRIDESLPPLLRGKFPANHPNGRNVLLFPWECELAQDRGYAPFHRLEFAQALTEACGLMDAALLAGEGHGADRTWWRDVTEERREQSSAGLGEHVYRVGVGSRKVSLLVYSSVSTATEWSRPASDDAIRFVYEVRKATPPLYLDGGARVNRTGLTPLDRVRDRVFDLLAPGTVSQLARLTWSLDHSARR
ncbi:hypothetical protein [Paucibacter soli]|uniref:hypothetical protein n=1 Tax=Paucibacter soli TaxID=3133433 RepID=UPI0030AA3D08